MERNLNHRVETCFPIEQPRLAERVLRELEFYINDGRQRWEMHPDGSYQLIQDSEKPSAQLELLRTLSQ